MSFDHAVDFLVIGTGAAGMAGALRAESLGLETLLVEASDKVGGSTAISGGVVWIPNNPQLPSRGIDDSREDSLAYLKHITKGEVPDDRLEAYVDESVRMLAWLEEHTEFKLDSLESYADYYAEAPGGKPGGRSMEPVPFDATKLGADHFRELRRSHPQSQVMGKFGITAREAHGYIAPTLSGYVQLVWRFVQWAARYFKRRGMPRDTKLHAGNALIARLFRTLLDKQIPYWLNSPAKDLIIEGGKVVGAVVERDGKAMRVEARNGVLLAAGGFEHNQAWRDKYHSMGPSKVEWNAGNTFNVGQGIQMGIDAGGAVERMHDAWWTPVTRLPKASQAWVLVVEKSLPGSIFVNGAGKRFTNEAAPYLDVVEGMYAGDAVPVCWMLFDAEYRRLYPVGPVAPGYAQPDHRISKRLSQGFFTRAPTLRELADKLEIDADAVEATVAHFNAFAIKGEDPDHQRGEAAVDVYYADRRVKPNASLRPLTKGPFYAIPVFPGDLGTKGGLVTDPKGRVLMEDGTPIDGLFAAGNTSAAVMGPSYPGAGGTIGPALCFGFLAAEGAASA
ncbi:MAG: FAD-binding protein [Proteobacteria bacterium]|nr:FAD-binding protein [Pseudomonadota bacterium]